MTLLVMHMDLAGRACSKAAEQLGKQGVDTCWGANGLVGETAIKLLKAEGGWVGEGYFGQTKRDATPEEIEIAQRYIMGGLMFDWPEKYGDASASDGVKALLAA